MKETRSFRFTCQPEECALVKELLAEQGILCQSEDFHPLAARVVATQADSPSLGASLAAFFGLIYIQDRSSMLPVLALNPPAGATVLDMCASPGSKTGFLAALVGRTGLVLANEPNRDRLMTLRRNLARQNAVTVITSAYKGEKLPLPDCSFDYILLDAPCSGWGTEKKHPNIRSLWQGKKIKPLIGLQSLLLEKAARLLKPGGRLVYSTCTTNEQENEAQVALAVDRHGLRIARLDPVAGFVFEPSSDGFLKVDSSRSQAQGFFVAGLTKPGPAPSSTSPPARPAGPLIWPGLDQHILTDFPPEEFVVTNREQELYLSPALALSLPEEYVWQGYNFGRQNGPETHLYPTARLFAPKYSGQGLNFEQTRPLLALISGRSLDRPAELAQGWAPMYFKGLRLGLAKVKGDRVLWTDR